MPNIKACLDDWAENPMEFVGQVSTTNKIVGLQVPLGLFYKYPEIALECAGLNPIRRNKRPTEFFFLLYRIWVSPLQDYSQVFMNIGLAANFASYTGGPTYESYRIFIPII